MLKSNKKLCMLVFLFFFLVYLISGGGHLDAHDGVANFLVTENMVIEKSIKINPNSPSQSKLLFDIHSFVRFHGDMNSAKILEETGIIPQAYVNYALFLPAIGIPFYIIADIFNQNPIHIVPYFTNALIISLTNVVVFAFTLSIYKSKKIAFVLSIFLGLTSFIWAYTSSMFPQPLLGLLAISAFYFIFLSKKNNIKNVEIIGGILLGSILLSHPSGILLIPGILIYGIFSFKTNKIKIIKFIIAFLVVIIFTLYLNEIRFDSFLDFGYRDEQSLKFHTDFKGILGMMLSPGKGILYYFPLSILVPISVWKMFKQNKAITFVIIYSFIVMWLWFGTVQDPYWGANGQWGPRYLVPILPFLILPIGILLKNSKKFNYGIIGLATTGFIVNLGGALVWNMYAYAYGWVRLGLWKYGDESWSWFTWDPTKSPIILTWNVLNSDYLSTLEFLQPTIGEFLHIGLAPCQYDSYLFCTNGVIPIIMLSGIILIITYAIWRNIKK